MFLFLLSDTAAVVKIPFHHTITFLFKSQNRSARVTESSFSCLPSLSFCLKKKREGTEACSNRFNNLAANCQKVFQGFHAIEPGERNLFPYSSPQPSIIQLLEAVFVVFGFFFFCTLNCTGLPTNRCQPGRAVAEVPDGEGKGLNCRKMREVCGRVGSCSSVPCCWLHTEAPSYDGVTAPDCLDLDMDLKPLAVSTKGGM